MSDTLAQDTGTAPAATPAPELAQTQTAPQTQAPAPAQTQTQTQTRTAPAEPDKTQTQTPASKWPEDWREQLAAGDEKRLRQLQRYSDVAAAINKGFALEAKLSSSEYKRDLPKDAKPEEIAEWRKEHGLPEKPEDYKPELPDGVVLGESDKATLEAFQKFAFDNNLSQDTLNKTLGWYYAEQDRATQERDVVDQNFHEESKDQLMSEWGLRDYRQNIAAMGSIRDQMPDGLADRLLAGRTADGRLIGDDPQFLRWFATLAREINPTASVVGLDGGKTVETELEAIRNLRRTDPNKYDQDKAMQARELELLTAQAKTRARG